jgi:GNAT superfamily N-acetyltransferase
MTHLPLMMLRPHLAQLPEYPLPAGVRLRGYRAGDEAAWARLWHAVGEFATVDDALARFSHEFLPHPAELATRCLLLETEAGEIIGTGTAWYDDTFQGADAGRVHWIAIDPGWHGRGLGKPLVAAVLARLALQHTRAYLATHTGCQRAIGIYLDFGFRPLCDRPDSVATWRRLARELGHPALAAFRGW